MQGNREKIYRKELSIYRYIEKIYRKERGREIEREKLEIRDLLVVNFLDAKLRCERQSVPGIQIPKP